MAMHLLDRLSNLGFHRLDEVPRREEVDPANRRETTAAALFAALVTSHARNEPVAVAWMRATSGGPVEVCVGGGASLIAATAHQDTEANVPVLYPPGSRGKWVSWQSLDHSFARFPSWLRCTGVLDVLAALDRNSSMGMARGRFEDYIAHLAQAPFAWVVVGEPKLPHELPSAMQNVELKLHMVENTTNEKEKLEFERLRMRYRELARAASAGMWNIHVLVGGVTELEATRIASLLCSASDIAELPYVLWPGRVGKSFTDVIGANQILAKDPSDSLLGVSPFEGSTELLGAIARPPIRELPGIRLVTPHTFDVTAEKPRRAPRREMESILIPYGTIQDVALESAGQFVVSTDTLNRHTFVCGATGSGKSQSVRELLEQLSLSTRKIPWLVIEPAKAEYARMAGRLAGRAEVLVIRPGDPHAIPASLNPLEPEPGFPLQTHIDLVRALFLAAFESEEPFPQVLSYALTRCYENLGWDLALGESKFPPLQPRYPSLSDLQWTALQVVENIGYGREVTDNVRGFIDVRIGSLRLGTPGRFFEGGHPLDIEALLQRNVVIEIEDVGNDQDKAFLIGTVFIRLVEHLRVRYGKSEAPQPLRHITVVEEAHRLLKNVREGSPAAHAVALFAGLLAEIRAYGEGIIVAEQIPSKILPDVIKNTALKVVHRLPAKDDRESVGATMNLDEEQSEYVVTLQPGVAAVFVDGMDRPLLVRMPLGEDRESARLAVRKVPVKKVRSTACSFACREERPCTLQEMALAARLAEDPKFMLWIEMIVVAHLIGMSSPIPDAAWLTEAAQHQRRTLECAIGQCAQAAINARDPELARVFQSLQSLPERIREQGRNFTPEKLAEHVRDVALAQLGGQRDAPCSPEEVGFQAGPYRWRDVRADLRLAQRQRLDGPHPKTKQWKDERGLSLPGDTPSEQRERLLRHPAFLRPRDAVVHGLVVPSRIEQAVAKLSHPSDWTSQLREALAFLDFGTDNWSEAYVRERRSDKSSKKGKGVQ